jgi:hypothetical protein
MKPARFIAAHKVSLEPHLHLVAPPGVSVVGCLGLLRPAEEELEGVLARMRLRGDGVPARRWTRLAVVFVVGHSAAVAAATKHHHRSIGMSPPGLRRE